MDRYTKMENIRNSKSRQAQAIRLGMAIKMKDFDKVINLIDDRNTDVNYPVNNDGDTPLILASRLGFYKLSELLVNAGADVNKKNYANESPLTEVVRKNTRPWNVKNIAALLIDAGADVNHLITPDGVSILQSAISHDHKNVAEMLIEKGANIDHKSDLTGSVLHTASLDRDAHIVNKLVEMNVQKPLSDRYTPLVTAINSQYRFSHRPGEEIRSLSNDKIDALLAAGHDINERSSLNNETALTAATRKGKIETVKHLLEKGADPHISANDGSPLVIAQKLGFTAIESVLNNHLAKNPSMPYMLFKPSGDFKNDHALIDCVKFHNTENVQLLLSKYGHEYDENLLSTAKQVASEKGFQDVYDLIDHHIESMQSSDHRVN